MFLVEVRNDFLCKKSKKEGGGGENIESWRR